MKYLPEYLLCISLVAITWLVSCTPKKKEVNITKEQVGKLLFFDESLSEPAGQSCATCHTPETGFADKENRIVSEGAVKGLFSSRNSMTASYTAYIPPLSYNQEDSTYVGGLFWDGRANSLEDQAKLPFTNPLEMANKDSRMVVEKIKKTTYYHLFKKVYGEMNDPDSIFNAVADAIAAYERSIEFNSFTSKYDNYLDGNYTFTAEEARGLELFKDKGMCAECHILEPDSRAGRVLFTDHTYDNLGIPANPANPFYNISKQYNPHGRDTVDIGLGQTVNLLSEYGKFRVPTLRNVELTAPYGHNGYFKTLEDMVHFYNVRDVGNEYPKAEYPATMNKEELGDLKLTQEEEACIVAFMKTLTDKR